MEERNTAYYEKYPEDAERVKTIIKYLQVNTVLAPSGGKLSASRFMSMGLVFGFHGGLDSVHDVVLRAWNDLKLFGFLARPVVSISSDKHLYTLPPPRNVLRVSESLRTIPSQVASNAKLTLQLIAEDGLWRSLDP